MPWIHWIYSEKQCQYKMGATHCPHKLGSRSLCTSPTLRLGLKDTWHCKPRPPPRLSVRHLLRSPRAEAWARGIVEHLRASRSERHGVASSYPSRGKLSDLVRQLEINSDSRLPSTWRARVSSFLTTAAQACPAAGTSASMSKRTRTSASTVMTSLPRQSN